MSISHYALNLLLKKIGSEPDPKVATELAETYTAIHVETFGPDGAFDAGVDLGYMNCVRRADGLPELELKGMKISK